MIITMKILKQHKACADQIKLFAKVFPGGTTTALTNLRKGLKAGLDISWLERFIPAPSWDTYDATTATAWATFKATRAPEWAIYEATVATALATFKATVAPARAYENEATRAPARATFEATRAPEWAIYEATVAPALAKALKGI